MNQASREALLTALNHAPETELSQLVKELSSGWTLQPKALPESGLGLLKLKDCALGDEFYLGEFPLATCWLTVATDSGEIAEGAALIMDDRLAIAEQLAFCDAVLSAQLPGWEQVLELAKKGEAKRAELSIERKSLLAMTRVDFSLLDEADEHA